MKLARRSASVCFARLLRSTRRTRLGPTFFSESACAIGNGVAGIAAHGGRPRMPPGSHPPANLRLRRAEKDTDVAGIPSIHHY